MFGEVHDNRMEQEVKTCKRFLVDFDKENWKHRVFNFAIDSLNPHLLKEIVGTGT